MRGNSSDDVLLLGAWKWHKNAAICFSLISTGVALWLLGSVAPMPLLAHGGLLKLCGLLVGVSGTLWSMVYLAIPFLDRFSARNALWISLDQHRLIVRGSGRLTHISQAWTFDAKQTFSDSDVLIADALRLKKALDSALKAYSGVCAPTLVIQAFWRGAPFHLRSAELYVVNEVAGSSQALRTFVIQPDHPLFNSAFQKANDDTSKWNLQRQRAVA